MKIKLTEYLAQEVSRYINAVSSDRALNAQIDENSHTKFLVDEKAGFVLIAIAPIGRMNDLTRTLIPSPVYSAN